MLLTGGIIWVHLHILGCARSKTFTLVVPVYFRAIPGLSLQNTTETQVNLHFFAVQIKNKTVKYPCTPWSTSICENASILSITLSSYFLTASSDKNTNNCWVNCFWFQKCIKYSSYSSTVWPAFLLLFSFESAFLHINNKVCNIAAIIRRFLPFCSKSTHLNERGPKCPSWYLVVSASVSIRTGC